MHATRPIWQYILLIFVLSLFVYLYLSGLGGNLTNEDEGTFLYQAWRVAEGDKLYADFYTSRWPLFILTGSVWINILGVVVAPIRFLSVLLTFGTAALIPLIMRHIVGKEAPNFLVIALLASGAYLLNPAVIGTSRYFTTEPYYVFFGVLAFYAFLKTHRNRNRWWLLIPAFLFTISAMYKVLGNLMVAGCAAYLAGLWLMQPDKRKELMTTALVFGGSYLFFYGSAITIIALAFPNFTDGVLGANFADDSVATLSLTDNFVRLISYLRRFFTLTFPVILVGVIRYPAMLREYKDIGAVGWQVPTVLGFVILSRKLFVRLFVYLNPFLAILFGVALIQLSRHMPRTYRLTAWGSTALIGLVALVFWPPEYFIVRDGTPLILEQVEALSDPSDLIIADYQMHNYLAERQSTFQGAEVSSVIIRNGVVSADGMIAELEADKVKLIILDLEGSHYLELPDFEKLEGYIEAHYTLEATLADYPVRENDPEMELRLREVIDYLALNVAGIEFDYVDRYLRRTQAINNEDPNVEIWLRNKDS